MFLVFFTMDRLYVIQGDRWCTVSHKKIKLQFKYAFKLQIMIKARAGL